MASSKYKYVYLTVRPCGKAREWWRADVPLGDGKKKTKLFKIDKERECALWVDKVLLENGKEPVNILKRKNDNKR